MNAAIIVVVADLEEQVVAVPAQLQLRLNSFDLTDALFKRNFRLTKFSVNMLIQLITPFMVLPNKASDLDVETKVLIALNFYATGSYQTPVGASRNLSVSQSSVSRCLEEVTNVLNRQEIFETFVKFPETIQDLNIIRQNFLEKFRLRGVVGCIDCTHVAIVPPDRNAAEQEYVNRKNYHSINVQLVCDANLKILSVNARFGGRAHDSYIWSNSNVKQFMEVLNRNDPNYFLLGDSGYALRPYLLTPYQNPPENSPGENFNKYHLRTRAAIERCNGVLKMRFRCLLKHRVLHYTPNKCSRIINACVVLHNICIENNADLYEDEIRDIGNYDLGIMNNNRPVVNQDLAAGRHFRNQVAAHLPPY